MKHVREQRSNEPPVGFPVTRWSLVVSSGAGSTAALEELCRLYWFPLYHAVRRGGVSAPDAEDVTQSFFLTLVRKGSLASVDPQGGKLRSYLLKAIKNHQANWRRSRDALKRGGGKGHVPFDEIDFSSAEERSIEAGDATFDQEWALAVLSAAADRLEREMRDSGRGELFEKAKPLIIPQGDSVGYQELAASLGVGVGSVRVTIHRIRQRFRSLLREQVADTVASEDLIDDELQAVYEALVSLVRAA